jgi:hypothetical protein
MGTKKFSMRFVFFSYFILKEEELVTKHIEKIQENTDNKFSIKKERMKKNNNNSNKT